MSAHSVGGKSSLKSVTNVYYSTLLELREVGGCHMSKKKALCNTWWPPTDAQLACYLGALMNMLYVMILAKYHSSTRSTGSERIERATCFPMPPTRLCNSFSSIPIHSDSLSNQHRACDHNWQNHSKSDEWMNELIEVHCLRSIKPNATLWKRACHAPMCT